MLGIKRVKTLILTYQMKVRSIEKVRDNDNNQRDEKGMGNVREEMRWLRAANEDLRKIIVNMEQKWEAREQDIVRRVIEKVGENLEEMQEKEKRKKNIVMFNVPESEKEPASKEEETEDRGICESIFQDMLKVKDAKIESSFHLGRRSNDKIRPLVIQLNEVGVKWALVAKSRELYRNEDEMIKKIIIAPDLTKKEREENYKLQEELGKRREQRGQWIIKKGRVVRKHGTVSQSSQRQ
ncbi:hypothetical protein Pcinc_018603 [Petrolisthes cinctipes]|uniref:Uncharacterized protein n=1 Tax=Petrolisthes cinctipes TaxID=88211 RepID=A0AAE1FLV6_PETCI|nr:hypothetical protein Pcinc_018603 [Petrolisthes cinctipes]